MEEDERWRLSVGIGVAATLVAATGAVIFGQELFAAACAVGASIALLWGRWPWIKRRISQRKAAARSRRPAATEKAARLIVDQPKQNGNSDKVLCSLRLNERHGSSVVVEPAGSRLRIPLMRGEAKVMELPWETFDRLSSEFGRGNMIEVKEVVEDLRAGQHVASRPVWMTARQHCEGTVGPHERPYFVRAGTAAPVPPEMAQEWEMKCLARPLEKAEIKQIPAADRRRLEDELLRLSSPVRDR